MPGPSCAFSSRLKKHTKEVCLKAETKPHLQVSACLGCWQGNGEGHGSAEALGAL